MLTKPTLTAEIARLARTLLAFFDPGSPVALLSARDRDVICFAGVSEGKLAAVPFPLAALHPDAPQDSAFVQTRLVHDLRALGVTVSDAGENVPGAIKAALADKRLAETPSLRRRIRAWLRTHAPYAFAKLHSGKLLALNRSYKPLGLQLEASVNYEEFDAEAEHFICEPASMDGVWVNVHDDGTRAFLYDDDPVSWRDYFARLIRLDEYLAPPGETAPLP